VRIKSAALAADAGEKNESAGGVAESISSLEDFIQLAEGLRRSYMPTVIVVKVAPLS
jgi:hypothetical protein